jgi:hypothetical protein
MGDDGDRKAGRTQTEAWEAAAEMTVGVGQQVAALGRVDRTQAIRFVGAINQQRKRLLPRKERVTVEPNTMHGANLMNRLFIALALLVSLTRPACSEPIEGTMLPLRAPGGFVMMPDGVTLIVSQPEKGELVYFDTVAEQEVKRIEVDFRPAAMALQGNTLYVAAKGAAIVYALDAKTGKQQKEIPLDGDGIAHLACHPAKGLVYASTTTLQVYAIDPASGTASKTRARGSFLVVDPVDAAAVFTGVQPPDQREIIIEDLPGGTIKIYWDRWGARAFILKYAAKGKDLKLVSSQKNAAVNAYTLNITPDGKKVLMTSGGGWRPPVEGGTGGGYICAAFSTSNLATRVGELPTGTNMAFHPVLNVGVLNHQGRDIQVFNPRSLIAGKTLNVAKGADARPLLLTFGGKGTKVILWNGDNPSNPQEGLHFLPLELTAADRTALAKVYGKLPPAVAARSDLTPAGKAKVAGTKSPSKTSASTASEDAGALPAGVIAIAGFNDAKGLNSTPAANTPYPLGKNNAQGGFGERGWQGVWPGDAKASFVKDNPGEGDGAVHLTATTNYGRFWTKPQTGSFKIELMVRCPAGGGVQCYVWNTNHNETGPMWGAAGGKFHAINGDGSGTGPAVKIADCKPDTWHRITLTIDTAKQRWTMAVDGKGGDQQFGFRYGPTTLRGINFLVEGRESIYIDAIRVLEK